MRKHDDVMSAFMKCAQKVAEREVINNITRGYPFCGGVIHQPKRPEKRIIIDKKRVG